MSQLISRTGLIQTVKDWLVRSDLTDLIPTFIDMAESRLKRDWRVRRYLTDSAFTLDSASESLPDGFTEIDSLTFLGVPGITNLRNGTMADVMKQRRFKSEGGPPVVYAISDNDTIHFGPEPDQEYTLEIAYWQRLYPVLSESQATNWLLDAHPDIYLYSVLVETAPYLKDDPRLETWNVLRETAIEDLERSNTATRFGGNLSRPAHTPIG